MAADPTIQLTLMKALVALFKGEAPDNLEVTFGEPTALSSSDLLVVGMSDPEASGKSSAAESNIDWGTVMTPDGYAESGEVMCAVIAQAGGDDLEAIADTLYGILGIAVNAIRDNYIATNGTDLLGVTGLWELRLSWVSLPVLTPGEGYGGTGYLLFRLAYQATT